MTYNDVNVCQMNSSWVQRSHNTGSACRAISALSGGRVEGRQSLSQLGPDPLTLPELGPDQADISRDHCSRPNPRIDSRRHPPR